MGAERIGNADGLGAEITAYWDGRAQTYSNGVIGELGDERRYAWEAVLSEALCDLLADARAERRQSRVADLGCGPGFFTILLACKGIAVDAIDGSAHMLDLARKNVQSLAPTSSVTFCQHDLQRLPYPDETFDACVSRNVTWLMRDPVAAYAEWLRVLRPGGRLIVFDANWYRYLVSPTVDFKRRADQSSTALEGWDDDSMATSDEERRCELIAEELPLTPVLRPEWDVQTLRGLGAAHVSTHKDVWRRLWTPSEQAFYASSPLFMIEVVK